MAAEAALPTPSLPDPAATRCSSSADSAAAAAADLILHAHLNSLPALVVPPSSASPAAPNPHPPASPPRPSLLLGWLHAVERAAGVRTSAPDAAGAPVDPTAPSLPPPAIPDGALAAAHAAEGAAADHAPPGSAAAAEAAAAGEGPLLPAAAQPRPRSVSSVEVVEDSEGEGAGPDEVPAEQLIEVLREERVELLDRLLNTGALGT